MKKFTKHISALLALIIALSAFAVMPVTANAETAVWGDFEYEIGYYYNYGEDQMVCITKYIGSDEDVTIPSEIDGLPVTVIGLKAFYENETIKKVTIPESVRLIKSYSFSDCVNLDTVVFSEGLDEIETLAFWKCESLYDINLPESLNKMGSNPFGYSGWYNEQPDGVVYLCDFVYRYKGSSDNLQTLEIKDGAKHIASFAFSGCKKLKSVTMPDSMESVNSFAFDDCTKLESVDFGSSLKTIGQNAFLDCESLKTFTLPETLKIIDYNAFVGCASIEEVNIPDSVEYISHSVFENCTSLKKVTIGSGVTEIGIKVFLNCTALEEFVVDSANEYLCSIDGVLYQIIDGDSYTLYAYPNKRGSEYTIPDYIFAIGMSSFYNCDNLQSITIPESVRYIRPYAFENCPNLKSVTLHDKFMTLPKHVFGYMEENSRYTKIDDFTIYGYVGSLAEDYANENGFTFIPLNEEPVTTEPITTAPVTTEPVTTEPVTTEPVTTEPLPTLPIEPTISGDVDGDDKINIKDVTFIQKAVADIATLSEAQSRTADVNRDGKVNVKDATAIQKYIAGIDTGFEIGSGL